MTKLIEDARKTCLDVGEHSNAIANRVMIRAINTI
jgi:hypothetical protein